MVREGPRIQSEWILTRSIPGIEAPLVDSTSRAGPYHDLPAGAQLLICGGGFDEHTIKVLWENKYYFVYVNRLTDASVRRDDHSSANSDLKR